MNFFLYNEIEPNCGPDRWRSTLINLASGVHRTAHVYQVIKERFTPSFVFVTILFPVSTYELFSPNPHAVPYSCCYVKIRIELAGLWFRLGPPHY